MKIIIILCAFLIVGCAAPKEEVKLPELLIPPISRIYNIESNLLGNGGTFERLNNRIENIKQGEIEEVVLVNTKGEEKTVTDDKEIQKFKEYMDKVELEEEYEIRPDGYAGIGVKLKDKEMILLDTLGNRFCLSDMKCAKFNHEEDLYYFLESLEGEIKTVQAYNYDAVIVDYESWADLFVVENDQPEEPPVHIPSRPELPSLEDRSKFVVDNNSDNDAWEKALVMLMYIQEDFTSYKDIQGTDDFVSGLIQNADGYTNINSGYTNRFLNSAGIELFLKSLYTKQGGPAPNYFRLYPVREVEQQGKQLFGDDYILPETGDRSLSSTALESFSSSQTKNYFTKNSPYEYFFPNYETVYIREVKETGNQRIYTCVKFLQSTKSTEDWPIPIIANQDGKEFIYDSTQAGMTMEAVIEENITKFDQWQYTLEQQADQTVRILSASRIVKGSNDTSTMKIDLEKPDYYEENERLIINHQTKDARAFNQASYFDSTYKTNENAGLLTIVMHKKDGIKYTQIVVFDTETWECVSDAELMKRLNINLDRLDKALIEVRPECKSDACYVVKELNKAHDYGRQLKTNTFFISSDNQFGMLDLVGNEIILFDWEEVQ